MLHERSLGVNVESITPEEWSIPYDKEHNEVGQRFAISATLSSLLCP